MRKKSGLTIIEQAIVHVPDYEKVDNKSEQPVNMLVFKTYGILTYGPAVWDLHKVHRRILHLTGSYLLSGLIFLSIFCKKYA